MLEMGNREILQKEKSKYKGTLVLDFFDLVEFIDIIDGEDDYYYVYKQLDGETYHSSCVCSFTPLKGMLTYDEYNRLNRLRELNKQY